MPATLSLFVECLGSVDSLAQFAGNIIQRDLTGIDGDEELLIGFKVIIKRDDKAIYSAPGVARITVPRSVHESQYIVLDLIEI
jgi:hypothetical protein